MHLRAGSAQATKYPLGGALALGNAAISAASGLGAADCPMLTETVAVILQATANAFSFPSRP